MSEEIIRWLVLGGLALAVAAAAWRARRVSYGRPVPLPPTVHSSGLGPGVHFFSSSTCSTCVEARKVLAGIYGSGYSEIRYEDDPVGFGRFEMGSVPAVVVIDPDGGSYMIKGVPRRRDLPPSGDGP
ncbi:MAG: hypothetical protein ACT4OP_02120 [Actinomycetota bacterium]